MRIISALIIALLAFATACGSDDAATSTATSGATSAATQAPPPEPAETEAAAGEAPTEDAPAEEAPAEEAPAEAPAGGAVVLEAGALGIADDGGSITRLGFGEADQATAVAALTAALGEPTSQQEALECGPGALDAVNWDGLSSYYQDGTLAGWLLQDPAPGELTTVDGVGLGTKLGDLRAAYGDVTVEETSIGFEFTAGDLSGTLTADSDHDTVVTMWSGANCIAR